MVAVATLQADPPPRTVLPVPSEDLQVDSVARLVDSVDLRVGSVGLRVVSVLVRESDNPPEVTMASLQVEMEAILPAVAMEATLPAVVMEVTLRVETMAILQVEQEEQVDSEDTLVEVALMTRM